MRGLGCLGCGGVTLAVLAVLALSAWNWVIRPAQDFLAGWQTPAQTISAPQQTAQQVNAPLTKADLQKFVQIRRAMRTALGTSFTDLQKVWNGVAAGQTPTLLEIATTLRQTAGQVGAAREQQRRLLAQKGMSEARYATVRAAVNRALGVPSVDLQQAAQALQQGQLPDLNTAVRPASAQEKALVAPFATELRASAAAGLLGL